MTPHLCARQPAASRPASTVAPMFSTTTMASSTTMPMASTRPNRVSTLMEKPSNHSTAKVPMIDTRHGQQRDDRGAPGQAERITRATPGRWPQTGSHHRLGSNRFDHGGSYTTVQSWGSPWPARHARTRVGHGGDGVGAGAWKIGMATACWLLSRERRAYSRGTELYARDDSERVTAPAPSLFSTIASSSLGHQAAPGR